MQVLAALLLHMLAQHEYKIGARSQPEYTVNSSADVATVT